jgi:hypothetical protein
MLARTVGAWMVDYRPYSLLLRLGTILLPILAGVLAWSYYHPLGSILTPKAAVVIPAPTSKAPNPTELAAEPADPADPAAVTSGAPAVAAGPAAATSAVLTRPVAPNTGAALGFAPDSQMPPTQVRPPAGTAATIPALPGTKQQPAPGREPSKARDTRKQEAAFTHRTIQKLDNEINRKLSIFRGC